MCVNGSADSEYHYDHDCDGKREQAGIISKRIQEETIDQINWKGQNDYEDHQSEIMTPEILYVIHLCLPQIKRRGEIF